MDYTKALKYLTDNADTLQKKYGKQHEQLTRYFQVKSMADTFGSFSSRDISKPIKALDFLISNREKLLKDKGYAKQFDSVFDGLYEESFTELSNSEMSYRSVAEKGDGIADWFKKAGGLSQGIAKNFADADSFQGNRDVSRYRDRAKTKTDEAFEAAAQYAEYLSQNKDEFDKAYGSGSADKTLAEIENQKKHLSGQQQSVSSMREYWGQFESQQDYDDQVAAQAEYSRMQALDVPATQAQLEKLTAERERLVSQRNTSGEIRGQSAVRRDEALGKRIAAIDAQILKVRTDAFQGGNIQKAEGYKALMQQPDFESGAAQGAAITNDEPSTGLSISIGRKAPDSGIRNKVAYGRNNYDQLAATVDRSKASPESDYLLYKYMTDEEVSIYDYLLYAEGDEAADEYLDSMTETLSYRMGSMQAEGLEGKPVAQFAHAVPSGLARWAGGMKQNFYSDSLPTLPSQYAGMEVREDLQETGPKLPEWMGGASLGQLGYDLLETGAAMAPSIAASTITGAPAVGLGVTFAYTKGNAYKQALDEGFSKPQAEGYSMLIGASEAGLQYLLGGISKLGGAATKGVVGKVVSNIDNAFLRIAAQIPIRALGEGVEEYLQEVLEPVFRNMALGEANEIDLLNPEAVYAAFLGAIMGGTMDLPGSIGNTIGSNKTGGSIISAGKVDELIGKALALDPKSSVYEMAAKMQSGALNKSDINIGELAAAYTAQTGDAMYMDMGMDEAPAQATAQQQEASPVTPNPAEQGKRTTMPDTVAERGAEPATQGVQTAKRQAATFDDSGAELTVTGIASVQDSKVYVRDASGEEVALDTITISDPVMDQLYSKAAMFDTDTAKAFVTSHDGKLAVSDYTLGFTAIYGAARKGTAKAAAFRTGIYAPKLSRPMQEAAFIAGQNSLNVVQTTPEITPVVSEKADSVPEPAIQSEKTDSKPEKKGNIVRKYTGETTKAQERHIEAAGKMLSAIGNGRTVVFEDTITEYKGRALKSGANAYFDAESNEYHIALDSVGQAYMYIAVHETTHDIAVNNKAGYDRLSEIVMDMLREKGQDIDALLDIQKALHPDQDVAYWTEEVVANTVPVILTDEQTMKDLAERIAGESEETRSAFLKLLDAIKSLLQKAYDILKGEKSWAQMKAIEGDIMAIANIREAYTEALEGITELQDRESGDILYSLKENSIDKATLEFLNSQKTVKVYRAMQKIDGDYYPPMAARVKGEDGKKSLVSSSEMGKWEQAIERPELITKGNKFNLDKANGSSVSAAYNPYFHTSLSPLNDQFSSAYKRDNLVVVEGEVPISELTSGYKAEFAKDAVGEVKWNSGPVSSKLPKGKERKVILSRWFKPLREVPNAEIASKIADLIDGEGLNVPYNVVTPSLRKELERAGVEIKFSMKDSIDEVKAEIEKLEDADYKMELLRKGDFDELTSNMKKVTALKRKLYRLEHPKSAATVALQKGAETAKQKVDMEYFAAIANGDMQRVQQMVDDYAAERGYERADDYRIYHTAPVNDGFNAPIYDLTRIYPDDVYSANGVQYYGGRESYDSESMSALRSVKGQPDKLITIYRAVPNALKETAVRNGDWVSVSKSYAELHGKAHLDGYKIISNRVPAKHVYTDANSLNEQGYDNGKVMAYANTKNNAKLLDPITYDDFGQIIPLSKRFDRKSDDIRFSLRDTSDFSVSKLEKDNAKLTEAVDMLKAQFKLTQGHKVSDKALAQLANKVLKSTKSEYDAETLTENLRTMFDYLANAEQPVWDEVSQMGVSMAKAVIEQSRDLDKDTYQYYADARKYLRETGIKLNDAQRAEAAYVFGDYRTFRQTVFGNVKLVNDGIDLDIAWQELAQKYPELFDSDIPDVDMPQALSEAVEAMRPQYVNPYGYNMNEAAYDLFLQIHDAYFNIPEVKTFADKKAAKLQQLKMQYRTKINDIRDTSRQKYAERLKALRADNAQKRKDLVARYNEAKAKKQEQNMEQLKKQYQALTDKMNEKLLKQKAQFQKREEVSREKQKERELRGKIRNIADDFKKRILNPTDNRYVPKELMLDVLDVAQMINLESGRDGKYGGISKANQMLDMLYARYAQLAKDPDYDYSSSYDQEIADDIAALSESIGDAPIRNLKLPDLQRAYEILRRIQFNLRNAVRMIGWEKSEQAYEVREKVVREVRGTKGSSTNIWGRLANKYLSAPLSAMRMFRRLAGYMPDSQFEALAREINDGQHHKDNVRMMGLKMFQKFVQDKAALKEFEKFQGPKAEWIDIGLKDFDGNAIKMTRAMRVALYLHSLNEDNAWHITHGGVRVPNEALYKKGEYAEAYDRGNVVILSPEFLDSIKNSMTEYEKRFAQVAFLFFNEFTKGHINETSMKLKGYKLATVEYYFPINVDKNFLHAEFESLVRDGTIEGRGSFKSRVQKSAKPIYLEDATAAIMRQLDNVAMYAGLAIPLRNFNKVYRGSIGQGSDTVQNAISQKWGEPAKQYIEKLMSDLQGAQREAATRFDKIKGNFAQAVLGANVGVSLKQAASYVAAAAVVGYEPLIKALKAGKVDIELVAKYTALLWLRSQGKINTELAEAVRRSSDWTGKVPWLLNWIQTIDVATVSKLWFAAEFYVQDGSPNLKVGTDAYYEQVAETYNRIIEETQPNYSVMQRPGILRSRNKLTRSLTMFLTQRLQNFNIVYDAVGEHAANVKRLKAAATPENLARAKESKTTMTRAITSQALAAVIIASVTLVKGLLLHGMWRYRDDEDELTADSVFGRYIEDIIATLVGSVLGGGELYTLISNIFNGRKFDLLQVPAVELINNIGAGISDIWKYATADEIDGDKLYNAIEKVAFAVAMVFKVPAKNVKDIFAGIVRHVQDAGAGRFGSFESGIERTVTSSYETLYRAMVEGDKWKTDYIRDKLANDKDSPKSPKDIDTGIARTMMAEDARIAQAYKARAASDFTLLKSIMRSIAADGFGMDIVTKAINLYENAQAGVKDKDLSDTLSAKLYGYDDLYAAIRKGNEREITDVYEDLLKHSTAQDPEDSIRSKVVSEFKPGYIEAVEKGDTATMNDIAKKLAFFGVDDEKLADWNMGVQNAGLKDALAVMDMSTANSFIAEQIELGKEDGAIKSLVTNTVKPLVIEAYERDGWAGVNRYIVMLSKLNLKNTSNTKHKGKSYYYDDFVRKWVQDYLTDQGRKR